MTFLPGPLGSPGFLHTMIWSLRRWAQGRQERRGRREGRNSKGGLLVKGSCEGAMEETRTWVCWMRMCAHMMLVRMKSTLNTPPVQQTRSRNDFFFFSFTKHIYWVDVVAEVFELHHKNIWIRQYSFEAPNSSNPDFDCMCAGGGFRVRESAVQMFIIFL